MKRTILIVLFYCVSIALYASPVEKQKDSFRMGTASNPKGATIRIQPQTMLWNDKPVIPVMGEFHFSRVPEQEWRQELLKMQAGGINIIASYIFWIHHEEVQGEYDWSGQRNLTQFVELCNELDLKLVLRLGPWCHGEVRNGGFPEWMATSGIKLRENNPAYLDKIRAWFSQIYQQVRGQIWKDGGPIIGIQIENEYRGRWEHLAELKKIAVEVGFDVPLYTRTGWPQLGSPAVFGEIIPLYGDYADGFWDRSLKEMPGDYSKSFLFRSFRNSTVIATEQLPAESLEQDTSCHCGLDPQSPELQYPYFTCELGGGMMPSYHRRINIHPMDVYAMALVRVGSGSNLPGYYMYHGGTNPVGKLTTLNEEQATPMTNYNDLPVKTYDFQAPLGEFGQVNGQYHLLRRFHLFLQDFGNELALMSPYFPEDAPTNPTDDATLRWSTRHNGKSGFVFVNNYQRLKPLSKKEGVLFTIDLPNEKLSEKKLTFPDSPVSVPEGAAFFLPFNMQMGNANLIYATAQPIAQLTEDNTQTFFFAQITGIPADFVFEQQGVFKNVPVGTKPAISFQDAPNHTINIVVLDEATSLALWKGEFAGKERIFLTNSELTYHNNELQLTGINTNDFSVAIYPAPKTLKFENQPIKGTSDGLFTRFTVKTAIAKLPKVTVKQIQAAGDLRKIAMGAANVAESPKDQDFEQAAVWQINLPKNIDTNRDLYLQIPYTGDVARIYSENQFLTDNFYNGKPFELGLKRFAPEIYKSDLTLQILPLQKEAPIYLQPEAKLDFKQANSRIEMSEIKVYEKQAVTMAAEEDVLFDSQRATLIYVDAMEQPVVQTALALLQQDVQTVFGSSLQLSNQPKTARIVAGTIGVNTEIDRLEKSGHIDLSALKGKWETFRLTTIKDGKQTVLIIAGSDPRGTAYGILELSRMIGVSPWYDFADVKPNTMSQFIMPETNIQQSPSVQYRGIFLNDEDWGLLPWSSKTVEPSLGVGSSSLGVGSSLRLGKTKGAIGPKTYARIFELLLRLRANTIWPAMHETTVPFYFVEGNKEMATQYGIVVGTSHCEPLMRNSATEWDIAGEGDYNYVTNKEGMLSYWTDRLNELQDSENIYTIGLRGKHDGMMQGVTTLEEHKSVLSQVLNDQRELLRKHLNPDPTQIPQIFVPYKEVLDVYDAGLEVPDEVTLVWCDDNYGYIRRLSNEKERLRSGGSGVYYHVSYWGRPHDYLWLASTSPALVHTEMQRAYEHGADKLWILNVGDIKPAEYLMEYFLDMAWYGCDGRGVARYAPTEVFNHLEHWAVREFGAQHAEEITAILQEYYRLVNFRKPEHTGWSRVEEPGYPRNLTPVIDSEYNPDFNNELQNRLQNYLLLADRVKQLRPTIPENRQSAFFQLVEYPVRGASLLNQKWLYAQLNDTINSMKAYDEIEHITADYNNMENGKWNRIMSSHPRNLPVFETPTFPRKGAINRAPTTNATTNVIMAQNATQAINAKNNGIEGLGHSFSAVPLVQNDSLTFVFDIQNMGDGWIKIAAIPNHDVDGQGMKIALSVDDGVGARFIAPTIDYSVEGRSETWKQNVLRGQVLTTIPVNFQHQGKTTITIKALTPYIIIDQIMVGTGEMNFYEFPIKK